VVAVDNKLDLINLVRIKEGKGNYPQYRFAAYGNVDGKNVRVIIDYRRNEIESHEWQHYIPHEIQNFPYSCGWISTSSILCSQVAWWKLAKSESFKLLNKITQNLSVERGDRTELDPIQVMKLMILLSDREIEQEKEKVMKHTAHGVTLEFLEQTASYFEDLNDAQRRRDEIFEKFLSLTKLVGHVWGTWEETAYEMRCLISGYSVNTL